MRAFIAGMLLSLCTHSLQATSFLYFYNPNVTVTNYNDLKSLIDVYLASEGNYQFQPFDNQQNFENVLLDPQPHLFMLTSYQYEQWNEKVLERPDLTLTPLLVGAIDGKSTYSKVLTSKTADIDVKTALSKRIAFSGDRAVAIKILNELAMQADLSTRDNYNVIEVPKDLDALMSVTFGVAQVALTANTIYEQFKQRNSKQSEDLKVLAESAPISLPIVTTYLKNSQDISSFIEILEKMQSTEQGQEALGMLGLTGWLKVNAAIPNSAWVEIARE